MSGQPLADQPGRLPSPEDNAIQEDPNNVIVEDHQPDKDDDSEGSQLPDIDLRFIESRAPATGAVPVPTPSTPIHEVDRLKTSIQGDPSPSRGIKSQMAFMKELREHGLTLAEIECKVNAEFPPLADMYHDKGDESTNESDDSL
ncbi:hypothetical protein H4Q26_000800 [Puccinia striiformis f. sp. tritici PST-130]|nr:hypothetical protein H4Q26_000800 [Puccinia striiformis f. sp. tritici PST-130]